MARTAASMRSRQFRVSIHCGSIRRIAVEGIKHFSHLHGLMPRLGFVGHAQLPFGFDDGRVERAEARIAHRARSTVCAGPVRAEVAHVPGVTLETPVDFNRFDGRFNESGRVARANGK
jgi:hypothetical protein